MMDQSTIENERERLHRREEVMDKEVVSQTEAG